MIAEKLPSLADTVTVDCDAPLGRGDLTVHLNPPGQTSRVSVECPLDGPPSLLVYGDADQPDGPVVRITPRGGGVFELHLRA